MKYNLGLTWVLYEVFLELIERLFSYSPPYLTREHNIDSRRQPKSNISPSKKRKSQYCLRAVAWANIALTSQTRGAVHKKPFYNLT